VASPDCPALGRYWFPISSPVLASTAATRVGAVVRQEHHPVMHQRVELTGGPLVLAQTQRNCRLATVGVLDPCADGLKFPGLVIAPMHQPVILAGVVSIAVGDGAVVSSHPQATVRPVGATGARRRAAEPAPAPARSPGRRLAGGEAGDLVLVITRKGAGPALAPLAARMNATIADNSRAQRPSIALGHGGLDTLHRASLWAPALCRQLPI